MSEIPRFQEPFSLAHTDCRPEFNLLVYCTHARLEAPVVAQGDEEGRARLPRTIYAHISSQFNQVNCLCRSKIRCKGQNNTVPTLDLILQRVLVSNRIAKKRLLQLTLPGPPLLIASHVNAL